MKTLATVVVLFLSLSGYASEDCVSKMLKGQDSASHHVFADFPENMSQTAQAEALIERAHANLQCEAPELSQVICNEIIDEAPHTRVCYAEASAGYYLVSQDYVDSGNVVFSRWD